MDKGTFILALGFTVMVGMYALNMTRSNVGSRDDSDTYASTRQARQIAATGINMAVNKLRYNPNWTIGYDDEPVLGGMLDVTIDSINLPPDLRRVKAVGMYSGHSYEIVSIIQVPESDGEFNQDLLNVQSVVEMQGQTLAIQPGNNFLVNGNNWVSDSTYNPATATYGIGASNAPQLTVPEVETALSAATATNKVIGEGSAPSVISVTPVNMNSLENEVRRIATIVHTKQTLGRSKTWGTMNMPEVVYSTKSLTVEKSLAGVGVLFIDGNLTVKNTMDWKGYLIVRGNMIKVESAGNIDLKGAVFFGNGGNLKFGSAGRMDIVYSSNILDIVKNNLFARSNSRPKIVRTFEKGSPH